MKKQPKPTPAKVFAIRGVYTPDVISQEELGHAADLMFAKWIVSEAAHTASMQLLNRLKAGAGIEPGTHTFDTGPRWVETPIVDEASSRQQVQRSMVALKQIIRRQNNSRRDAPEESRKRRTTKRLESEGSVASLGENP